MTRRALALSSLWYLLLAALVFYPLHRRGYLLLLDWTPTPSVRLRTEGALGIHGLPALALLKGFGLVLPTWVGQRLILFGAVLGAGLAAHVSAPVRSQTARLFAGTLYAINPFVFVRILAGHWKLLIFYALAPLAARAILRMAKDPSPRSGMVAGAWIAGLAAVSVHALMLLVLLAATGVWMLIVRSGVRRAGMAFGSALLVVIAGILWWVVPAALEGIPLRYGADEIRSFASTATDGAPVSLAVAGLRGFWIERFNPSGPSGWPVVALVLAGLAVFGAALALRDRRLEAATLSSSSVFALVVAIGIANPLTAHVARAFYRWLPGFLAFREPHKLVALLALTYAWLGAVAVDWLYARRRWLIRGIGVGLVLVPLVYTPAIFGGLEGRLHPVEYPTSWTAADQFLLQDRDRFSTLFLPWKLYLPLPFNNPHEPVANPAPDFFSVPIISSQDPEVGLGVWVPSDSVTREIDQLILNFPDIKNFGARLAPLGIKYLMLVANVNVGRYDFLYGQGDLQVVFNSGDLVIFRNTAWNRSDLPLNMYFGGAKPAAMFRRL